MNLLTTNSDQIIIYLKGGGGSTNNIEGPSEVLQKFIIEQVYNTNIFKLSLYIFETKKDTNQNMQLIIST